MSSSSRNEDSIPSVWTIASTGVTEARTYVPRTAIPLSFPLCGVTLFHCPDPCLPQSELSGERGVDHEVSSSSRPDGLKLSLVRPGNREVKLVDFFTFDPPHTFDVIYDYTYVPPHPAPARRSLELSYPGLADPS